MDIITASYKKNLLFLIFVLLFSATNFSQDTTYRKVTNEAFTTGEFLKWRFYYDSWLAGITAGYGEVTIKDTVYNNRDVYHLDAKGYTIGMFNWFFKVRDNYHSYMDKEMLAPHYFVRRTREGGYKKHDEYQFNQKEHYVKTRTDSIPTTEYIQDFISALYFARTFNSDTLKAGDIIPIEFFIDDSVYNAAVVFEGKEIIQIKLGTFSCLKLRPGMATGEVFSNKYPVTIWITDDKNHIPILAKSAIVVGNLKAELKEYGGLANEFTSLIELKE
jgi:hypothetical protein